MKRADLHVGQKVNLHDRGTVRSGEVTKIGRTLVTIKYADVPWSEGTQFYIDGGHMKSTFSGGGYFFRTDAQEEEHEAYEKAKDVLKQHGFEAYRVQDKQKVIAVAGLLLNEFGSQ